jgi:NAD(P)-dependent dehydrogenase (short-subunit alcohol dehydrogenase family)
MSKHAIKKAGLLAGVGLAAVVALRSAARQRARMDFRGKTVVITGGSRGLGLVLAHKFAGEGARLAILARDPAELERAGSELREREADVLVEVCDVTNRSQVEEALAKVVRAYGQIHVLVNNAGIIQVGPVEHMRLEDFEDAMNVHFWGPLYSIMTAMHYMKQQGGGRIVNIGSIGGKVAVPHLAPYTASKFALQGLSDAMRAELAGDRILVTSVSPGLMRTGSYFNAQFQGQHEKEHTWFSTFDALPVSSIEVQKAAEQIIEACRYGDAELTITPQARWLALSDELFPRFTAGAMKIFNRLLPRPAGREGDLTKAGWESTSRASPSPLTRPGDEAARKTNQAPGPARA